MSIGSKFKDHLMELLLDPEMACKYLTEAMSNKKVNIKNKDDYFKIAILDVAKAYGITNISNKTGIKTNKLVKYAIYFNLNLVNWLLFLEFIVII